MILYTENSKRFHQKSVRTNKFSEVSRYKINIQKSFAFLYSNNELAEREINKSIYHCIKNEIKYLEINLNKEVKDLCTEKS